MTVKDILKIIPIYRIICKIGNIISQFNEYIISTLIMNIQTITHTHTHVLLKIWYIYVNLYSHKHHSHYNWKEKINIFTKDVLYNIYSQYFIFFWNIFPNLFNVTKIYLQKFISLKFILNEQSFCDCFLHTIL